VFHSDSPQIFKILKFLRKMQTREKIFQKKGLCWTVFYHMLSLFFFFFFFFFSGEMKHLSKIQNITFSDSSVTFGDGALDDSPRLSHQNSSRRATLPDPGRRGMT
jgi:hypothetical protein